MDVDFYATAGALTGLTPDQAEMICGLALDPEGLCRAAQGLLISPPDAASAGLPEQRMSEINIRPASALLQRSLELDGTSALNEPRPADRRVVGTCRHYAVLATAGYESTPNASADRPPLHPDPKIFGLASFSPLVKPGS